MVLALATWFVSGVGDLAFSFLQIVVTSDDWFKGANLGWITKKKRKGGGDRRRREKVVGDRRRRERKGGRRRITTTRKKGSSAWGTFFFVSETHSMLVPMEILFISVSRPFF